MTRKIKFASFLPKIAYHSVKGNQDSVRYFVNRQIDMYGGMTASDIMMLTKCIKVVERNYDRETQLCAFVAIGVPLAHGAVVDVMDFVKENL